MNTLVVSVDKNEPQKMADILAKAGEIIKNGGLVAFPTETVYGLGGDALNPSASKQIYEAKGRPSDNPLIVHIAEFDKIYEIAREVPEGAKILADKFWPGPLTMIVNKNERVPYETTGGLETVAVRLPSDEIAREFIKCAGGFIAAPSANTSGRPSPTLASHVVEDLSGKIDMIIDGGKACIGLESTIVDLTGDKPVILRPGYVTAEMLKEVFPETIMDPGLMSVSGDIKPKAPGMKYRHYAPGGEMFLIEGADEAVEKEIINRVHEAILSGKRAVVIATEENKDKFTQGEVLCIGTLSNEETVAANLYDVLRRCDEIKADVIFSPSFPKGGIGAAIYNRMLKAAGHTIISV